MQTNLTPNLNEKQAPGITPEQIDYYVRLGWPLFPCRDKRPLTEHGFKDATLDRQKIRAWAAEHPGCNWGTPTGPKEEGGSGLVVIDIDKKSNGFETWEQLREQHSEPIQTVTTHTGGGGQHLIFRYPSGHLVKSGSNVLGPGIDVRACGGYIVVPPSITEGPYTFELTTADAPIADLPAWLLACVNGRSMPASKPAQADDRKQKARELAAALMALNSLSPTRADDYQSWLEVGMALREFGADGLTAWDAWSKKSPKYQAGACAAKWRTFTPVQQGASKITARSLKRWATEDAAQQAIPIAPKQPKPSDYVKALAALGYSFQLNDMNDAIIVNGLAMTDALMGGVEFDLREHDYKSEKDTQVAIFHEALEHTIHPIKDYLNELRWGGADAIGDLAAHFDDQDELFPVLLRKWLIGAVGRILGPRPGQQHPMLVIDGRQGIGKSRFVSWLGSPLPAFYIEGGIDPDEKDFLILLCSKFVWSVEELGSTVRRADIEALKSFLSKEIVTVRRPYGHNEIVKPATASFIGTINNAGGFLADPSGNRRFRVCTLTRIDWAYENAIDINQVWAQAVALFGSGETWQLDPATEGRMLEINARYDVDDPLQFDLVETFEIDPADRFKYLSTAQIIHRLRVDGKLSEGSDQQIALRIAGILTKIGCERDQIRLKGQVTRVWRGVSERQIP